MTKICGCSDEVANYFQGRPLGFYGLASDAVPAAEARDLGYPGFAGLKLPDGANAAWKEPYIYHFPDGNASLARLMVRALIPRICATALFGLPWATQKRTSCSRAESPSGRSRWCTMSICGSRAKMQIFRSSRTPPTQS